jgi:ABC-type nickel/cobalt efflux system permease component RcnA
MHPTDFKYYFLLGWDHIISFDALDHLYFIAVLSIVYQFKHWKQVLVLVTAFTVGHAVTLFLSGMDLVRLKDSWVEFAIPCTIVFSSLMNFRKRSSMHQTDKLQYAMALFFGLVHGLGFANTVRFMISKNQDLVWSLFGFNVGLEIGQIFVVLLVLLISLLAGMTRLFTSREWVLSFSSLILGLALKLSIERFPF